MRVEALSPSLAPVPAYHTPVSRIHQILPTTGPLHMQLPPPLPPSPTRLPLSHPLVTSPERPPLTTTLSLKYAPVIPSKAFSSKTCATL